MISYQLSENEREARERLCLALDLYDENKILQHVAELSEYVGYFKVNFAFAQFGPSLVQKIKDTGSKVFLDVKIHDIPNVAAGYADAATRLGVDIVTVHVGGGAEMMEHFVTAAKQTAQLLGVAPPKVIGVTLLTNIDERVMNVELNVKGTVKDEVMRRAQLAVDAGLDGIVCSAADLPDISSELPKDFYYVTPGVRPTGGHHDDHKRVASYTDAIKAGSNLLVVGRDVLTTEDRRGAARRILQQIAGEL